MNGSAAELTAARKRRGSDAATQAKTYGLLLRATGAGTLRNEPVARSGEIKIVLEPHPGSHAERLARAAAEAKAM